MVLPNRLDNCYPLPWYEIPFKKSFRHLTSSWWFYCMLLEMDRITVRWWWWPKVTMLVTRYTKMWYEKLIFSGFDFDMWWSLFFNFIWIDLFASSQIQIKYNWYDWLIDLLSGSNIPTNYLPDRISVPSDCPDHQRACCGICVCSSFYPCWTPLLLSVYSLRDPPQVHGWVHVFRADFTGSEWQWLCVLGQVMVQKGLRGGKTELKLVFNWNGKC